MSGTRRWMWMLCLLLAGCLTLAGCSDDEPSDSDGDGSDTTDGADTDGTDGDTADGEGDTASTDGDTTDGADTDATDGDDTDTTECCTEALCNITGEVCNTSTCLCEEAPSNDCTAIGGSCDPALPDADGFRCEPAEANPNEGTCQCSPWFSPGACGPNQVCAPTLNQDATVDYACAEDTGTVQAGGACTSDGMCAGNAICLAETEESAFCRDLCDPDATGSQAGVCTGDLMGCSTLSISGTEIDFGACVPVCDPWPVPGEGCEANEWCLAQDEDFGSCLESGATPIGDACTDAFECEAGAICLGSVCTSTCKPGATSVDEGACELPAGAAGVQCFELQFQDGSAAPFGACGVTCDPWAEGATGCSADEFCFPDGTTPGVGQCSPMGEGLVEEGGECIQSADATPEEQCMGDLLCISDGVTAFCRSLCDPNAGEGDPGSCPGANSLCSGLSIGGEPAAFGSCVIPECDPTQPDGGESSCTAPEQCLSVDAQIPEFGDCVEVECDPTTGGTACSTDPIESCIELTELEPTAGQCEPGCDADADIACVPTVEVVGSTCTTDAECDAGQICDTDAGICLASADCLTAEFASWALGIRGSEDLCVPLTQGGNPDWPVPDRARCDAHGLTEFQFCGPSAICIAYDQVSPDVLCYATCRANRPPGFNSDNHPDCGSPTQVCSNLFGSTDVGICVGQ